MLKRRAILVSVVLVALVIPFAYADGLFAQFPQYSQTSSYTYSSQLGLSDSETGIPGINIPSDAVLRAIGDSEYPVTPGDMFTLSYSDGKNLITLEFQADNDCRVAIPSIDVIDAAGMTYKQFKANVEETVSKYYTYSSPQLMLTGCGVFSLKVTGEVGFSQYVTAWGCSRLSDLAVYAGEYASTRKVEITYRNGNKITCDLFNALRNGSDEDNPLLAPGCEVRFLKASVIVSLDGAVARAGVYQPLDGENLYDLIRVYGGGLLNSADTQSIRVSNYSEGSYVARYMTLEEAKNYIPVNGDVVNVIYSAQKSAHVSITGAIAAQESGSLSMANSLDYSFAEGETGEHLISSVMSLVLSTGDISSAYILRDGRRLELSSLLQAGDNIIIPFSRQTVTVTGYVNNPGTFAFVPDMTSDYYIALAGGFSASSSGRVKVLDASGNKVKAMDNVPSGATIVAKNNNFTTGLAITGTVVSLVSNILLMITYGHTVLGYFPH